MTGDSESGLPCFQWNLLYKAA